MIITYDAWDIRLECAKRLTEWPKDSLESRQLIKLYEACNLPHQKMCNIQLTHEEALLIFKTKQEYNTERHYIYGPN